MLVAQEVVSAKGHSYGVQWSNDATYHWRVCSCGEIDEKVEHKGGEATETEKAVCEDCGASYGDLKEPTETPSDILSSLGCAGSILSSLFGLFALTAATVVLRKKREE